MTTITYLDESGCVQHGILMGSFSKATLESTKPDLVYYNVYNESDGEYYKVTPDKVVDDTVRTILATYPFTDEELHEFIHHQWGFNSRLAKMLVDECYKHLKGE